MSLPVFSTKGSAIRHFGNIEIQKDDSLDFYFLVLDTTVIKQQHWQQHMQQMQHALQHIHNNDTRHRTATALENGDKEGNCDYERLI